MPKTVFNQTNFTAGELTPRMKGRGDVARHQNGAEVIENGIIVVHGGIKRRDGTRFLQEAKYAGARAARVIRYVYNIEQSYALEFGHQYVRAYDGITGAVILNSGLTTLEIASPYTEAQLFEITHKQQDDVLYLFHPDVPTHQLRRITPTLWTLLPVRWIVEPFAELGHLPSAKLTLSASGIGAGRTFTTAAATVPDAPTIGTATPFNGSAYVGFTGNGNGGAAVDYYTATSSPGGITATNVGQPIHVTGLTNGVAYTFTVTAHNAIGDSLPSAASGSVTPLESLGAGSITASASPSPFAATLSNGTQAVTGPTASGTSGTAPYSYSWAKISGASSITISAGSSATVTLSSTGTGTTRTAALRCTVTDAVGNSGTVDVNISILHTNGGGSGGGTGSDGYWPPGAEIP